MRQPQNAKRGRGRGRRGNGNNNHHNHVPNRNTSYESNGPDVKLRGNAQQLHEKYMGLAHDAASAGERISAEAYTQFADHYFRLHQAAVGFAETKRQQDQAAAAVAASDQAFDEATSGAASDDTSSATDDTLIPRLMQNLPAVVVVVGQMVNLLPALMIRVTTRAMIQRNQQRLRLKHCRRRNLPRRFRTKPPRLKTGFSVAVIAGRECWQ